MSRRWHERAVCAAGTAAIAGFAASVFVSYPAARIMWAAAGAAYAGALVLAARNRRAARHETLITAAAASVARARAAKREAEAAAAGLDAEYERLCAHGGRWRP